MHLTHRPGKGRPVPSSTYRVQITPDFGFDAVAALAPYLAALGISHVYLSPILPSGAGSRHGYDVTSHGDLDDESGGRVAFNAMVAALRTEGLRVVADVVPNHMTVPTPLSGNAQFWSILREGRASPHAHWFDVDWDAQDGRLLLPVLGAPLADVLAAGDLTLDTGGPDGQEPVVRYYEHEFPVRPGTQDLPLEQLVDVQPYRLDYWRAGDDLNYRRFFDVTSLAAIRVEEPDVFFRTHAVLLDLVDNGSLDGLRIDHPDGLADPGGYLARLADATGDLWVVVEKILEGEEQLPEEWRCSGTTGYDALAVVGGLFVDPQGKGPLGELTAEVTGHDPDLHDVIHQAKYDVIADVLAAEVGRLMRLAAAILPALDAPEMYAAYQRALVALLVGMDRYRAYITPGEPSDPAAYAVISDAAVRARRDLDPADHDALAVVVQLASGGHLPQTLVSAQDLRREFVVRFQQTCAPVMAKGVEDTAFYRHVRLTSLNEVGGDPSRFGVSPASFHRFAAERLAVWPVTMTTLSTHDTKRSEGTRATLAALSERPEQWRDWLGAARELAASYRRPELDGRTEYLLWQSLIGAWPISPERLTRYALKAVKEAKDHTSWLNPDPAYEDAVLSFAEGIASDRVIAAQVETWTSDVESLTTAAILGQKLVQLTMPGVPDVYQGCELVDRSLVDPDSRRPVDFAARRALLSQLDGGGRPIDLDESMLLVTSRALRVRRTHPQWFTGDAATYTPLAASGEQGEHVLGFIRGDERGAGTITLVTRLAGRLTERGGWGDCALNLPQGAWRDELTGAEFSGRTLVADLLAQFPVALLVIGV